VEADSAEDLIERKTCNICTIPGLSNFDTPSGGFFGTTCWKPSCQPEQPPVTAKQLIRISIYSKLADANLVVLFLVKAGVAKVSQLMTDRQALKMRFEHPL
jgi:hypothetical protein